jgi:hypothetical protein
MITQQEMTDGHTLHIQVTERRAQPAQATETGPAA